MKRSLLLLFLALTTLLQAQNVDLKNWIVILKKRCLIGEHRE